MRLAFTKMEGAGNDFVVFDATRTPFDLEAAQLRRIADRHFGVGCDQILVVERSTRPDADFRYRIFNVITSYSIHYTKLYEACSG